MSSRILPGAIRAAGEPALLSPIISAFAAVTAALAIATGEQLAGVTLLGVIVTLAGMILVSASRTPEIPGRYQRRR
jgi:drug/metabolite transporter (DMT)-like permease